MPSVRIGEVEITKVYKENKMINLSSVVTPEQFTYYDKIPHVCSYPFNPKPFNDEHAVFNFYITDCDQSEYIADDTTMRFDIKYELDGIETWQKNVAAGDYVKDFGALSEGYHWFSVQVIDLKTREASQCLTNEFWVVNRTTYPITIEQTHMTTSNDLVQYNIKNDNSKVIEDMNNNRIGLSKLFKDLRDRGVRKCILPKGIYRINRCKRLGTIENGECPIIIPSGLTVDMNQATFKMHDLNDRDYVPTGTIENLIVCFKDCVDSHLINGIIEGNFAERAANGWLSNYNGEGDGGTTFYGGCFCSLEDCTITQVAGYNLGTLFGNSSLTPGTTSVIKSTGNFTPPSNLAKWNIWQDNKVIDQTTGNEIEKTGFAVSGYYEITDALLKDGFLTCGKWLAFAGRHGDGWMIDYHFYDANGTYTKTVRGIEYRQIRIPNHSAFLRMSRAGKASDIAGAGSIYKPPAPRYLTIKNCHYIDNRTCLAPAQFNNLLIDHCQFTRSGHSITPCAIDLEDGWENSQDFYLTHCEILEHSGTRDFIANASMNLVIMNCKNWGGVDIRYRVSELTFKDNEGCGFAYNSGTYSERIARCTNNTNMPNCSWSPIKGITNPFAIKNNTILGDCVNGNSKYVKIVQNKIYSVKGTPSSYHNNTFYLHPVWGKNNYWGGPLYFYDSLFTRHPNELSIEDPISLSFNQSNAIRQFNGCTFDHHIKVCNHNYFNSGLWNNCIFEKDLILEPKTNSVKGQIVLKGCTIKGNLNIIFYRVKECWVTFENCRILGTKTFSADTQHTGIIAEEHVEFINCTFV